MSDKMVVSENDAMELLAFLVTSSRGVIDEPELYGSFRLIDAASRLLGFILKSGTAQNDSYLMQMKDRIDTDKMLMMTDTDAYKDFVEGMVREIARELKGRS